MGLAYERAVDFYKDFHTHDRLSFVFPRGGCVMEIQIPSRAAPLALDSRVLLVLPLGQSHEIQARSAVLDSVVLYPAPVLLTAVAREDHIAAAALDRFSRAVRTLRRSVWMDQLLVEYLSRRVLASGGVPQRDLRFFEREITREVFRLGGLGQARGRQELVLPAHGVAGRAVQFIETNLFGRLELDVIAAYAHASVSTLLRQFSERTGLTPLQYARQRRLDEARALLRRGTHTVTDVAMLVGYENSGAFSEAFRAKFGEPPSRSRPRNRTRHRG
jgi:AraC-like DNA-binding protein